MQPPQHAHPHALDTEPRVERPGGPAKPELVIGDELLCAAQVHHQLVPADREDPVVGRRGRLLELEEEWRVEQRVDRLDGIESRRVGVEQRIVGNVRQRVIPEERNQPERDRDRDPGLAPTVRAGRHRPVGRVESHDAGGATEGETRHPNAARIGGQPLAGYRRGVPQNECHEPEPHDHCAHGSPRDWCR